MGTITKTFTETEGARSTWTLALSLNDVTVTDGRVDLLPTLLGKYSAYSGKNGASLWVKYNFYARGVLIGWLNYGDPSNWVSLAGNTNRNWSKKEGDLKASITAFNSGNPTDIQVPITVTATVMMLDSGKISGGVMEQPAGFYTHSIEESPIEWGTLAYIKLNAPPTFTVSAMTFDTNYVYTGLTTASVDVSSLSAKYGGSITEVKLTIGNQSVTRTNNGTLSILLETEGTFTPTVTVTDSRGQVTTKTLETITVNGYTAPSAVFTAERTTSTGVDDDEGEYAVLDTNITFTDVVADLTAPTVTIDGTPATVTWYSSRATDGTLSGTVNWSSLTSPATVYGLIDVPDIQVAYSISLTPNDTEGSGSPITQTIASAFYTIDFLAGGHGIAFGQPSSRDGFECNMPTTFHDTVDCEDVLTAPDMTAQEVSDFVDNLDVGGSGVAVDLVIEQGTSGMWTYKKWAQGELECWGHYERSSVSIGANGGVLNMAIGLLPFSFSARPICVMSVGGDGNPHIGLAYCNIYTSDTSFGIDAYWKNHRSTAHSGAVWTDIIVKGRWK